MNESPAKEKRIRRTSIPSSRPAYYYAAADEWDALAESYAKLGNHEQADKWYRLAALLRAAMEGKTRDELTPRSVNILEPEPPPKSQQVKSDKPKDKK